MITIKSRKAKARRLQNWVRDLINTLAKSKIAKSAVMGESGPDVYMNDSIAWQFPFAIECKSKETGFSPIYDAYAQAEAWDCGEPLVIIKMKGKKPLAVVDAKYFIESHCLD